MSPEPLPETLPVRARPSEARRARRFSWCGNSGASVATTMMIEPVSCLRISVPSRISRPTGTPAIMQLLPQPVVGLHQHPDGVVRPALAELARGRADAALEFVADHARPAADVAFGHAPGPRAGPGREDVLLLDVETVDVVEVAVIGLGDDRQRPPHGGRADRALFDLIGDDGVAHHADAVRVGDHDRPFEVAGLLDPVRARSSRRCR